MPSGQIHEGTIVARRSVGRHQLLAISAPRPTQELRPGNWAAIALPGSSHLLRRQLWIADTAASGPTGFVIEVLVDPEESSRRALAEAPVGSSVNVLAPLGRAFSRPVGPTTCLLAAVGAGLGAIWSLVAELAGRDCHVILQLFGESESSVPIELRRSASVYTSHRIPPRHELTARTQRISELIRDEAMAHEVTAVYSAGSPADLGAMAAGLVGLPVGQQVAVEAGDVCGTGICEACILPIQGRDGVPRSVPICTHGAVFPAELVRWADL